MSSVYPNATPQSHVWVPILDEPLSRGAEPEVMDYVLAKLDSYEADGAHVTADGFGPLVVEKERVQQYDVSHGRDQPDVAAMNNLDTGPLLDVLRRRYNADDIYTWTGKILISLNPYFIIPGIYDMPPIRSDIDSGNEAFREDPHVFTVAERAYCDLLASPTQRNQSLIVSGESGAGKTEACKRVMNMLAEISTFVTQKHDNAARGQHQRSKSMQAKLDGIEAKVLGCNPFLEAFGNAKTGRNDNSSRFGKFLKIEYHQGKIIGAHMKQYLLEKSRVINPGPDERSYHIFYQLSAGCDEGMRAQLKLQPVEAYRYLNRSGCYTVENMDDEAEFRDTQSSFLTVGIDTAMQLDIFKCVSAILTLGNVHFSEREAASGGTMIATVETEAEIATVAELISCPDLQMNLLQRQVRAGGGRRRASVTIVKLNKVQAFEACEALAKHLYGNLFAFLVTKVNSLLATGGHSERFIGILDIFGFEIFEQNSFEQLCINFTNEKLQNLFNHHVFTLEEQQYKSEGVDFSSVAIRDNTNCVKLIESKPHGILVQLDQICRVGRSSKDTDYLAKLDRSWGDPKNKDKKMAGMIEYYKKPKVRRPQDGSDMLFTVMHFAGPVHYSVDGFLEKNKDALHGDLEFMCESSDSPFIQGLFVKGDLKKRAAGGASKRGGGGGRRMTKMPATIAIKFKEQLEQLNKELLKTDPHYIRCIKPNSSKAKHDYTADMVLRQLIYSGVLETVRIRREGYPFRKSFDEFWQLCQAEGFDKLADPPVTASMTPKDCIKRVLKTVFDAAAVENPKMKNVWQCGHSKIFLKDAAYEYLLDFKRARVALTLQTWWRMVCKMHPYYRGRKAVKSLQHQVRGWIFRKRFAAWSGQAIRIQSAWRGKLAQRRVAVVREVIREQRAAEAEARRIEEERAAAAAAEAARIEAERAKFEGAVNTVGSAWRCYKARVVVQARREAHAANMAKFMTAVLHIQAQFRRRQKQREYITIVTGLAQLQRAIRRWVTRRQYKKEVDAAVSIQSAWRAYLGFRWYVRVRRAARTISSAIRGHQKRKLFRAKKNAVSRISRSMLAFTRNADMASWVQDVFTLTEVGDDGFVEDLLEFHEDVEEYQLIKDSRPGSANIRVSPSFATLLHSAAKTESASPVLVELAIEAGADLDNMTLHKGKKVYWCARDVNGNSPLHVCSALGDGYLQIAVQLVEFSKSKTRFINFENNTGATALDIAVENALSAASAASSSYEGLIEWLFSHGAVSNFFGTKAEVDSALKDLDAGRQRALKLALEREKRRAEMEALKLKETTAYKLAEIRANEARRKEDARLKKIRDAEQAIKDAERRAREEEEARIAAEKARLKAEEQAAKKAARDAAREEKRRQRREKNEQTRRETEKFLESKGVDIPAPEAYKHDGHANDVDNENGHRNALAEAEPSPAVPIPVATPASGRVESAPAVPPPPPRTDMQAVLSRVLQLTLRTEMALTGTAPGWFYRDSQDQVQGPFTGKTMSEWYSAGYLDRSLKVSSSANGEFYMISALVIDGADPTEAFNTDLDQGRIKALRRELVELLAEVS